jgi:TetR/AcrR family transcriptional regulator
MPRAAPGQRRQQILEALAHELETSPGVRVTTARLAAKLDVSEAALYRHFRSKAEMFEALIAFAEQTVFSLSHRIAADKVELDVKLSRIVGLILSFGERNPGICRLLMGDVLAGEDEALRARVRQFFERFEAELRAILRAADLGDGVRGMAPASRVAALLAAQVEGRLARFVRSGFAEPATQHWDTEWQILVRAVATAGA